MQLPQKITLLTIVISLNICALNAQTTNNIQNPNICNCRNTATAIHSRNINNNTYQFSIYPSFINGYAVNPTRAIKGIKPLWIFGDGGFSFASTPTYTYEYPTAPLNSVILRTTKIYTDPDDDLDARVQLPTLNNPTVTNSNLPVYFNTGKIIDIKSNAKPVAGDNVTYIVNIDGTKTTNCRQEKFLAGSIITFKFPDNTFDLCEVLAYNNEQISYSSNNNTTSIEWTLPNNYTSKNSYNYFVTLKTKASVNVGSEISVSATIQNKTCNAYNDNIALKTTSVPSHDPNVKLVNVVQLQVTPQASSGQLLEYTIHFQNTGKGPATFVQILDHLSELFDPNTFSFTPATDLKPSLRNFLVQSPRSNHQQLSWTFGKGLQLRGTNEPGYNVSFRDDDTRGWIKFRVMLHHAANEQAYLDYCGRVHNQARIIFDNNPPIYTNVATTNASDSSLGTECNPQAITIAPVSCVKKGENITLKPDTSNIINVKNYSVSWYPTTGFISPSNSLFPKVQVTENTTYHLTISKDFQQYYSKINVHICPRAGLPVPSHQALPSIKKADNN